MSASRLATTRPGYQASVPALADRAAGLTTFLDTHFSPTSLAALRAELTASVTSETMLNGARNNTITKLIPLIEAELDAGCTLLWQISRHLALLVPVIEDGNNFGVDVLQSTLKTVQDRESVISQYLGDLTTYFWQRGSILEKVGGKQWRGEGGVVEETKRTVTKGESEEEKTGDTATTGPPEEKDDPGGPASKKRKWGKEDLQTHNKKVASVDVTTKKGDVKTVTTTSQKVDHTGAQVLPDYQSYLISLDIKWFLYLKDSIRQAQDAFLTVLDVIEKNKEKVENPRGNSEGNVMSMF